MTDFWVFCSWGGGGTRTSDGVTSLTPAGTGQRSPTRWLVVSRRIDAAPLKEIAWPAEENPLAFSCGPTSFVEAAAAALVGLGYPPERVKTERFGATGG